MEILKLNLYNFRNFSEKNFTLSSELSVVLGPNGSGKSNILEAIALLSGMRPLRVATDLDLVKFGKSEARIEGRVESSSYAKASEDKQNEKSILSINFQVSPGYSSSDIEKNKLFYSSSEERSDESRSSLSMISSPQGRTIIPRVQKAYFVDSIKKRFADFSEHLSVVEFTPLDLNLVVGSPSLRRHHLDVLLSSLDREYWLAISSYNKIVVRRNKVLWRIAEGHAKPSELDFWDERLLEHGSVVSKKRTEFFEFLNFVEPTFSRVSRETQKWLSELKWVLKQSLLTDEKLSRNRERDIAAGMTLSGPHRDDFYFMFVGHNLEFFGSRGQQRMAVLALKLAELEYFAVKRGARPVLALDDIFSELDWEHREAVLAVIDKQQTIITAAERESLPKEIFKKAKVVELR